MVEVFTKVLPRLYKIKYGSDMIVEHWKNLCMQTCLTNILLLQAILCQSMEKKYKKVYLSNLMWYVMVNSGLFFSSYHKIFSSKFCARSHEEIIPRRLLIPQVSQLGVIAQKYQTSVQNGTTNLSSQYLQSNCNRFVVTTCQLEKHQIFHR